MPVGVIVISGIPGVLDLKGTVGQAEAIESSRPHQWLAGEHGLLDHFPDIPARGHSFDNAGDSGPQLFRSGHLLGQGLDARGIGCTRSELEVALEAAGRVTETPGCPLNHAESADGARPSWRELCGLLELPDCCQITGRRLGRFDGGPTGLEMSPGFDGHILGEGSSDCDSQDQDGEEAEGGRGSLHAGPHFPSVAGSHSRGMTRNLVVST